MKVKTSVTLSEQVLAAIDEVAGPGCNRSAVIEEAVTAWVRQKRREDGFDAEVAKLNAIVDGDDPPDVDDYSADFEELGDLFEVPGGTR